MPVTALLSLQNQTISTVQDRIAQQAAAQEAANVSVSSGNQPSPQGQTPQAIAPVAASEKSAGPAKGPKGAGGPPPAASEEDDSSVSQLVQENIAKVTPQVGAAHAAEVVSTIDGSIDYKKLAQIIADSPDTSQEGGNLLDLVA